MKNFKCLLTLAFCATLAFGFISCSNGGDDNSALLAVISDGGKNKPSPIPTATYTVTFNANDGSENPATATQIFTGGVPQALKTIAELGFSKNGFNFAGWGTSADASQASYADAATYTARANVTLYALWSSIPVYSVNIPVNANGTVTASPATAVAGTEITLSNTPNAGYNFASYTVTDADGLIVTVTDGTFTMPAKNVTVTAAFIAIEYNISVETYDKGSVTSSHATATVGTTVTLTAKPSTGYKLSVLVVIPEGGEITHLSGPENSRTFVMPAKNVTVWASFVAIKYSINMGTFVNGSVTTSQETAVVGTSVTLTVTPMYGYRLSTLVVTDEDGESVALGGTVYCRTFTMPAKNLTVMATFAALLPPTAAYTKTGTAKINGTEYDLVTFGLWPQTVKADGVTVYKSETLIYGDFTYCRGSDSQWYVNQPEKAWESGYKYSDGTNVAQSSSGSCKWFKVEPIKWRVLTTNYDGKKLLLAENILIGKRYNASSCNYQNSEMRKWLNSNSNSADESDYSGTKGFLKTAFTADQIAAIAKVSVDISARSSNPDSNATEWNGGKNDYASNTPMNDKVFLLSEQEVTKSDYGFAKHGVGGPGTARIRVTTDFAKASGATQENKPYGGCWWLRSIDTIGCPRFIFTDGSAYISNGYGADDDRVGVVPALCVEN